MNKICKEYISDAKKFFPIIGRQERNYLRNVSGDIEDLIEEENITSKSELIKKYRKPYEVANNYYCSFIDTDLIVRRIKISKYIKAIILTFIIISLIITSMFCVIKYQDSKILMDQEMVGNYAILETKSNEEIDIKSENYDKLNESGGNEISE